jgi:hypoxanthine phosphoribosyltransferase
VLTNWDYIYDLCRKVSKDIKHSGYEPDIVIALARGGWCAGRVLCDFLGLNDLTSLKMEHYVGPVAIDLGTPYVKYPLADYVVRGKKVLIVDDIVNSGESMLSAVAHVAERSPLEIKTASLQYVGSSKFDPDYVGERLRDWAWIIYPWNFMEDMISILNKCMKKNPEKRWDLPALKCSLYMNHSIDHIVFEITQPGRLSEILEEMERKGMISSENINGKKYWKLIKK